MKMWKILFCMGWLGCSVINYGFLYGAFRHLEVNEWHLITETDPSLHRTDCVVAGAFAITGPLGIGGDIVAQAWSGFPGWHVTDWDQMKEYSRLPKDAVQKNASVYKKASACRAHAARKKRKRTTKYIFRSGHIERYIDAGRNGARR